MNSAELELREEEDDGGREGLGEEAVAKSSVAKSSVFATGTPQEEQNRTEVGNSVPQDAQKAMIFPATV